MNMCSYDETNNPFDESAPDLCQERQVHPQAVAAALEHVPKPRELARLAEFFKLFGDPTRLRLLTALTRGELCVCDLAQILGMSHSATSHQLRTLRAARLVTCRRQGKMAFYSLDDGHVAAVLAAGLSHVRE